MLRLQKIGALFIVLLFLISTAFALCGDGEINAGEQCDGTNLNSMTCEKLDRGFVGGVLACNSDCTLNIAGCSSTNNTVDSNAAAPSAGTPNATVSNTGGFGNSSGYCGNEILEADEQCDGSDIGAASCQSLGFSGGSIFCTAQCKLDTSGCTGEAAEPAKSAPATGTTNPSTSGDGGILNDKWFPTLNFFSASSINSSLVPQVFAVVMLVWAMLMLFAALRIRRKREEEERQEILAAMKEKNADR